MIKSKPQLLTLLGITLMFLAGGCSTSRAPHYALKDAMDNADDATEDWIDDLSADMRKFRVEVDKALVDDLW